MPDAAPVTSATRPASARRLRLLDLRLLEAPVLDVEEVRARHGRVGADVRGGAHHVDACARRRRRRRSPRPRVFPTATSPTPGEEHDARPRIELRLRDALLAAHALEVGVVRARVGGDLALEERLERRAVARTGARGRRARWASCGSRGRASRSRSATSSATSRRAEEARGSRVARCASSKIGPRSGSSPASLARTPRRRGRAARARALRAGGVVRVGGEIDGAALVADGRLGARDRGDHPLVALLRAWLRR